MSEKKNIYNLDVKGMRGLIRDFSNTLYGRTVFFLAYFIPILLSYLYTGYVLRVPTLIVAAVTFLVAVMVFLSGIILQVLKKQHDQDFEHYLTSIRINKK